ncbi:MAG TPA: bifunctional 23S rRNA (guanine(2069)-N(7))-methyltransferase RlmK/23S rRNA (guanine(2445)-N(2))-methyltransferase RlmL [Solimonas sp.]
MSVWPESPAESASTDLPLFVTCARGVEPLLVAELAGFGAAHARERTGGVAVTAPLEAAYRACLWSRLASRVLMPLQRFPAPDADALYQAALGIAWHDLFDSGSTFAIEVAGRSPNLTHTQYAGLKVKDAIVDGFRAQGLERPNVNTESPDIRIHLHLDREHATLSLDLAGDSLHRRGYRLRGVEAPLKENLACAILVRCGWPDLAAQGAPLLDPMCGSGTLVIEAALMAADIAPGLRRKRWGFEAWLDHRPAVWKRIKLEAEERRSAGLARPLPILVGSDLDQRALMAARSNAERAGFADRIRWVPGDTLDARPPAPQPGLVVTNPPYGERIGTDAELVKLYSLLGNTLKQHFAGWRFGFFTARDDIAQRLGLRAEKINTLYNGALLCKLLRFEIGGGPAREIADPAAETTAADERAGTAAAAAPVATPKPAPAPAIGGEAFGNRLRKNLRHLGKWAKRKDIAHYRVYDADLPEYAVAVDLYRTDDGLHAHVQEYAAPKTVDPAHAEKRLREALGQTQAVLELPHTHLHYKLRQSQKGTAQYQRQNQTERFYAIEEHGARLQVNFDDYLDTGLFLDHRPIRQRIQQEARGKRFLNLFCYTGAATVHAVVGGARRTLSLDLSNTYLDWAKRNLSLNGVRGWDYERMPAAGESLSPHALVRADCLLWLREQAALDRPSQFDLIFFDPPTFSNSKKMEDTLDIQRDHAELIRAALKLLAPGGTLYFSTNRRGFKLDEALAADARIDDITTQTLDEDFKRPPPAHRCWAIRPITTN